ncbi:hypothetical protein GCM10023187_01600 [Nibrella viscosa]|uniref:Uncharacterized protein n=1 Tax=Nibrella viscosa TaxID=1084524 RepID=A0ABP8JRI7_9BACT
MMENNPAPATGFNSDPDAEKPAGAAKLMTPDNAPGPGPEDVEGDLDLEAESGL